jgi:hypothetical protein
MTNNYSIGLKDPDKAEMAYFKTPTLGEANTSKAYAGVTAPVSISQTSGIFSKKILVTLACPQASAKIYYTTDGSTPTTKSKAYKEPLNISTTTPLRAIAISTNSLNSEVATATYLFDDKSHGLTTVFLTTDHDKIFGSGGIYYAPIGSTKQVDAVIELIEPDGILGFKENCLLRKHGNMSSLEPQKSFAVAFRESVGSSSIEYNLFPSGSYKDVTTFRSFILRTSGNDWDDLKCKDAFIAMLARQKMDVDYQSYRPCVVYINGEYWGVYNIRDQQNEDYLQMHFGVDPNNVDIISFGHGIHEGNYTEYDKLISFIKSKDLNSEENWKTLEEMMDVDNMIDTYLCHIYYGNFDTVNIKWWRERKDGAKWRWMLYDLDYAFYLPNQNNLAIVTNPAGHGVNNYFPSTLIYNLMKSDIFKSRFLSRLSSYWGNIFSPDYMLSEFEKVYDVIKPALPDNFERWKITVSHHGAELVEFDDYVRRRPEIFREQVKSYFKLSAKELDKLLPKQTITHKAIKIDKKVFE